MTIISFLDNLCLYTYFLPAEYKTYKYENMYICIRIYNYYIFIIFYNYNKLNISYFTNRKIIQSSKKDIFYTKHLKKIVISN